LTAAARLDPAVIADVGARVAAERTAQGLPEHVEDGSVLGRVTALLLEDTSGPAVGHRAAQPIAAAKQTRGRGHHATGG
jgi:hypothetical protein